MRMPAVKLQDASRRWLVSKTTVWAVRIDCEEQAERLERLASILAGRAGRSKPTDADRALVLVRAVRRGLVELDTAGEPPKKLEIVRLDP